MYRNKIDGASEVGRGVNISNEIYIEVPVGIDYTMQVRQTLQCDVPFKVIFVVRCVYTFEQNKNENHIQ